MTAATPAAPPVSRVKNRPRTPIPVHVLTGFLGAGKTTLLARALRSPALADTAVIINEFGDVSLDHFLVERADEDIMELRGGCLCCQIRGDLVATLEDLLRRRDNGRVQPFRRVVIETTGLADPAPVLHAVMLHPYLAMRYALSAVITVVDAIHGSRTIDTHIEAMRQVAIADRIVITKTDLVVANHMVGDEAQYQALVDKLRTLNPAATTTAATDVDPARLFDPVSFSTEGKSPEIGKWLREESYASAHRHHAHDVNRHDQRIRAFALRSDEPLSHQRLDQFLDLLRERHGASLLRVKGIVCVGDHPDRPLVIHGVQHVFHPPTCLKAWPDTDRTTRIVCITCDGDPAAIEALFKVITAPDGSTAAEAIAPPNPLAAPGGARPFRPR